MCRIAGFLDCHSDRRYDHKTVLRAMRDELAYGGPDSAGEFFDLDDRLALGHRRLSIIDLSKNGDQPWRSGNDVIVFNGEFYNYQAARENLKESVNFSSGSDTEVLIKGIQKRGIEFLNSVRGMFGFALWNLDNKELLLCRDRVGVKPLYWYQKDKLFMFASELKAFHQHPLFDKSIDQKSVATYLTYGYIPAPNSIYQYVKKLVPGTTLKINRDQEIQIATYWSANTAYENSSNVPLDENEATDQLEEQLKESVELRMVADVPVGMFLSGGVDSSLVTAMLQKHSNQQLKTFTIGFEDKAFDESDRARTVAEHIGTKHHEHICTEAEFVSVVPKLPEIIDEPFGDTSIIPTFLVAEFAKQHVKVSLSADGGDELFGGYTKYQFVQQWHRRLRLIPSPARAAIGSIGRRLQQQAWFGSLSNRLLEKKYSNVDAKLSKFMRTLSGKDFAGLFDLASSYVTAGQLKRLTPSEAYRRGDIPKTQPGKTLGLLGLLDINHYLEGDILTKVDRATMRVALEGRDPLLDQNLIEFAFSLPDEYKIRGGVNKYLLRKVLSRYLPDDLTDHVKKGFSIPVRKWLSQSFVEEIRAMSSDQSFLQAFQFSQSELRKIVDSFLDKKSYCDPQIVWFLFVLYLWHQRWNNI